MNDGSHQYKDPVWRLKDSMAKSEMKIAVKMATTFGDFKQGEHLFEVGGWIDIYTYEPISHAKAQLRQIILALRPFISAVNWEWRVFAPDGFVQTWSDGSGDPTDSEYQDVFQEQT